MPLPAFKHKGEKGGLLPQPPEKGEEGECIVAPEKRKGSIIEKRKGSIFNEGWAIFDFRKSNCSTSMQVVNEEVPPPYCLSDLKSSPCFAKPSPRASSRYEFGFSVMVATRALCNGALQLLVTWRRRTSDVFNATCRRIRMEREDGCTTAQCHCTMVSSVEEHRCGSFSFTVRHRR